MTDDDREKYPSELAERFQVRLPPGLRDRIKAAAERNNRSMNSEIVSKLERYDSLGGEVDAMWEVARALATAIDEACREATSTGPLVDKINDAFDAVDDHGNFDRAKLGREYGNEAATRLKGALNGAVHIPPALVDRIEAKALKENRSFDGEVLSTLEREYPAPSDVMHVHLENIRRALDQYERETDPQARMRLQTLVEMMVTSGHNLHLDSDEFGEI